MTRFVVISKKLLERARQQLVKLAAEGGLALRRNYNREAPKLAAQVGRYAHAKQFKRMRGMLKKLKTVVGRVYRDVERKPETVPDTLRPKATDLLAKVKRRLSQKQHDKNKLYSLHAPEVECIAKGKARQPYEFGVKASIAVTHKEGLVVGMRSMPGNPYDALLCGCGHNLRMILRKLRLLLALGGALPALIELFQRWRRAAVPAPLAAF